MAELRSSNKGNKCNGAPVLNKAAIGDNGNSGAIRREALERLRTSPSAASNRKLVRSVRRMI